MKILVVQIGRIGDMILTTPVFRTIKQYIPGASVHVLSSARASQIVSGNPHIDKLYIYLKGLSFPRLLYKLRNEHYDVWIDPKDHYSMESSLLARLCNAKMKIGYNGKGKAVFDVSIPSHEQNKGLHAVERNLLSLSYFGIPKNNDIMPEIFIDKSIKQKTVSMVHAPFKKLAVINISAGDSSRKWVTSKWIEVIKYLENQQYTISLVYDPQDAEEAKYIKSQYSKIKLIYSPSIDYICAIISLADIIVTPDTSVVHIASAYNIPVIVLFKDVKWNIDKFKPLSTQNHIVRPEEGKKVYDISVQKVIDAIARIIERI